MPHDRHRVSLTFNLLFVTSVLTSTSFIFFPKNSWFWNFFNAFFISDSVLSSTTLETKQNENFVKLWHWNHSVFLKDAGRKFTKLIKEPQIIPIYNLGRGHVTMVMKYGCVFENKMFKFLTEWGAILSPPMRNHTRSNAI